MEKKKKNEVENIEAIEAVESNETSENVVPEEEIIPEAPPVFAPEAPIASAEEKDLPDEMAAAKALESAEEAPAEATILSFAEEKEDASQEEAPQEEAASDKETPAAPLGKKAAARARRAENAARNERRATAIRLSEERAARVALLSALRTAINRHTRYTGRVYTAYERDGVAYAAVMIPGGTTVLVPFDEMFRDNPINMTTVDTKSESGRHNLVLRQLQVLRRMVEAEIPVVIAYADSVRNEETGEVELRVIGSRQAAMATIEKINFPEHPGARNIHVEDIAEGTVMSVATHAMRVNIGGVDVRVPKYIATNAFVNDMTEMYHVNDKVAFYIAGISRRDSDGRVELKVDGRVAERVNSSSRLKLIPVGSEVVGTITSTRRDNSNKEFSIMYAFVDSIKLPCIINSVHPKMVGRDLKIGDRVRMHVIGHTDSGFLRTSVYEVLGSSMFEGR